MSEDVPSRLRRCYEQQDVAGFASLYAQDARWELFVGTERDLRTGREDIAARYADDVRLRPVVLRWDVRPASWGAVVEAEALQGDGPDRVRFRWVHLLEVDGDVVVRDTVYCTGALAAPASAVRGQHDRLERGDDDAVVVAARSEGPDEVGDQCRVGAGFEPTEDVAER